jgi:DNA polymerase V
MVNLASISAFPQGPRPWVPIPFVTARVCAGFPSPADDYLDGVIDLNELCISQPAATFFVRASGTSMSGGLTDIHDGDVLVVNRSRKPANDHIVVACIEGEFCVKRLRMEGRAAWLEADNPDFPPLLVGSESEVSVWGVVDWIFRKAA